MRSSGITQVSSCNNKDGESWLYRNGKYNMLYRNGKYNMKDPTFIDYYMS
jgi:hypothetical protein